MPKIYFVRETTTTKYYMEFWRKKKIGVPNCGNDLKKHTCDVTMIGRMRVKTCEKESLYKNNKDSEQHYKLCNGRFYIFTTIISQYRLLFVIKGISICPTM